MRIGISLAVTQPRGIGAPADPDVTAPVLSSPLGTQTGDTTATLGVTSNEASGTLYWSVLPSASAAPSAAAFIAGTTGGVATGTGSPASGANPFSATGLTASTGYKAHYFQRDAALNQSNIVSSATFTTAATPDVTAPTLSSPTDAASGSTGGTLSASTNEGNGTLYWFVSTSATPPTAANLKTGTGAVSAGSQSVVGAGVQNATASGLTASTVYYAHFLHRDAAGNDSAIVSGNGFTTDAAAPPVTLNPADATANAVLSNGDLTMTASSGFACTSRSTVSAADGDYYVEFVQDSNAGVFDGMVFGIMSGDDVLNMTGSENLGLWAEDGIYLGPTQVTSGYAEAAPGTVNAMAVRKTGDAALVWLRQGSGDWNKNASANPATGVGGISVSGWGSYHFFVHMGGAGANQWSVRVESGLWTGGAPSGYGPFTGSAAPSGGDETVSSTAELLSALDGAVGGDNIYMEPGAYSEAYLEDISFDSEVTITALDPEDPPIIAGLGLSGCTNITVSHVKVNALNGAGGVASIYTSQNCSFLNSEFCRTAASDTGGIKGGGNLNCTISGCELHHMTTGGRIDADDGLTITNCYFHDMQSDGFTLRGGDNITISDNRLTDFYPTAGHIDGFQLFVVPGVDFNNVTVTGNIFVRGAGDPIQGILFGAEDLSLPFNNVTVTGNHIIGGQVESIGLDGINTGTVANNIVLGSNQPDSVSSTYPGAWLRVINSVDVDITDNQATDFAIWSNTGGSESGNTTISAQNSPYPTLQEYIDSLP